MKDIIKQMRDGKWAVCKEIKASNGYSVIVPIDDIRYESEYNAIMRIQTPCEVKESPTPKVVVDKSNFPTRDKFRVVKLDKGVFAIEQLNKFYKWEYVKTCSTKTRAEEYIINHCQ